MKYYFYIILDNSADNTNSSATKKRPHGTLNCYNIQEGKIIDTRRPRCRYLSPVRSKNKSSCPLFVHNQQSVSTSTPIISKKILQSHQQQLQEHRSTDHLAETDDRLHYKSNNLTSAAIPYREKKNPLSSTRLSCYKPKISQPNDDLLPHYKSVDDFMFLNATDDLTSNTDSTDSDYLSVSGGGADISTTVPASPTEMTSKIFFNRKKDSQISPNHDPPEQQSSSGQQQSHDLNHYRIPNTHIVHDDTYGFATLKTKSVDNLCDQIEKDILRRNSEQTSTPISNKKKQAAAFLSNRIRLMSNRTQKLFHRFYSQHTNPSECSKQLIIGSPILVTPLPKQMPAATVQAHIMNSKNRRSLSYGHLPDIDDFQQNLKPFNQQTEIIRATETDLVCNIQKVSDTFGINADDTDSGILVNESGQSSIIETDDTLKIEQTIVDTEKSNVMLKHRSPINEYKFVRIHIRDNDILDRALRVVLTQRPRYSDNNKKRIGYHVTNILPGGLIER